MRLWISPGNSKIGQVPNISLTPVESCLKDLPCYKDCYANRIVKRLSSVRKRWEENLILYRSSPVDFFEDLHKFLLFSSPKYFRYHVGGDIPDTYYFLSMLRVADAFPNIRFLAYTRTNFVSNRPNLILVRSQWLPPYTELPTDRPSALVYKDSNDIPEGAYLCPGRCPTCGYHCWYLRDKDIVAFKKH